MNRISRPAISENVNAVILAAGEGRRMRPITELIPKPLIPINGKPFIEYLIENLMICGIAPENIILVVGYLKDQLVAHLTHFNPLIRTVVQPRLDGTAGALFCAMNLIPPNREIIMLMGDNYFSPRDLQAMLDARTHAIGVVRSVTPEKYGVIETRLQAGQPLISRILEKPKDYRFDGYVFVSAGLHYFMPTVRPVLTGIVEGYRKAGWTGEIPLTEVISELAATTMVAAVELMDWQDMGSPSDLPLMKKWILKQQRENPH